MPISPDLFYAIGEALFGPNWQGSMADMLDVAPRTIGRWLGGAVAIPDGVRDELLAALEERGSDMQALISELSNSTRGEDNERR